MAVSSGLLAAILSVVSLTLQGCFLDRVPLPAKLLISERCHQRSRHLNAKEEMKAVHLQSCKDVDAHKLKELNITDCKKTLADMVHFAVAAECMAVTGMVIADACGGEGGIGIPFLGDTDYHGLEADTMTDEVDAQSGLTQRRLFKGFEGAGAMSGGGEEEIEPPFDMDDPEYGPPVGDDGQPLLIDHDFRFPVYNATWCKRAVNKFIGNFDPTELDKKLPPDQARGADAMDAESPEAFLALTSECHKVVIQTSKKPHFKRLSKEACADNITDIGIAAKDCPHYVSHLFESFGTVTCIATTMFRQDLPDAKDVELGDIKKATREFGVELSKIQTAEEVQELIDWAILTVMSSTPAFEDRRRLSVASATRLFSDIRLGRWRRSRRNAGLSAASVAVAASCALLVALAAGAGLAALRSTRRRQDEPWGEKPIVASDAEETGA